MTARHRDVVVSRLDDRTWDFLCAQTHPLPIHTYHGVLSARLLPNREGWVRSAVMVIAVIPPRLLLARRDAARYTLTQGGGSAGIPSRPVPCMEHRWGPGRAALDGSSPRVSWVVSLSKSLPVRIWVAGARSAAALPRQFGPAGYPRSGASDLKQDSAATNAPGQHQVAFQLAARP